MKKNVLFLIFSCFFITFLCSCSNDEKKPAEVKNEKVNEWMKGTPEQQAADEKALERRFKPSEKKVW